MEVIKINNKLTINNLLANELLKKNNWSMISKKKLDPEVIKVFWKQLKPYYRNLFKKNKLLAEYLLLDYSNIDFKELHLRTILFKDIESIIKETSDPEIIYQISQYTKIDINDINKYNYKLNWKSLSTRIRFTEEEIEKNLNYLKNEFNTILIYNRFNISLNFIIKHMDLLNNFSFYILSCYYKLTNEFIFNYGNILSFEYIFKNNSFLIEIIDQLIIKFNLINHKNKKDIFVSICKYQELNDKFYDKYINTLNWTIISEYQKLDKDQLIKYAKKLNFKRLKINNYIEKTLLDELSYLPFKYKN